MAKYTVGTDQDNTGEIPLVQVFEEKQINGKMESERRTLESSPADTGVKAPKQPPSAAIDPPMFKAWSGGRVISLQVVVGIKSDKPTLFIA